jgi:hypothetical protein
MNKIMLDEVLGPINDLQQKLAGSNGRRWFGALKKFLRREEYSWGILSRPIFERNPINLVEVLGLTSKLLQKLAGDNERRWFGALKKFLRKEKYSPDFLLIPIFEVWKTVDIGTGLRTADEFHEAFALKEMTLKHLESHIFGTPAFVVSESLQKVRIVMISHQDLGFDEPVHYKKFIDRAVERGLEFCSLEIGLQLGLQYPDFPRNKMFIVPQEQPDGGKDAITTGFTVWRKRQEFGIGPIASFSDEYPYERMIFVYPEKK